MSDCNCNACVDGPVSSKCIQWEGKHYEPHCFEALIEEIYDMAKSSTSSKVDIKSLSKTKDLSSDEIIQILVNEVIRLKNTKSESTFSCSDLDTTIIGGCKSDLCASLEFMVQKIATMESEIESLKVQVYE